MKIEFKVEQIKKTKNDDEFYNLQIKDYKGYSIYKLEKSQLRHLIQELDNAIK